MSLELRNYGLLRIWLIAFLLLSMSGFFGAYFVVELWNQNALAVDAILRHLVTIAMSLYCGYMVTKLHFTGRREVSYDNKLLAVLFFVSILLYLILRRLLNIEHILLSSLVCFIAHALFLKHRKPIILFLGVVVLGFDGSRLTLLYMIFPLLLLRKYRKWSVIIALTFIVSVALSRSDNHSLLSLGSILGVEWRDFFLFFDDGKSVAHPGLWNYWLEVFILPIPGHSLIIDTVQIRMSSYPRLLAQELHLDVDGLRLGILNEVALLWGWKALVLLSFILGSFIKIVENHIRRKGFTVLNVNLCFVLLYILIGQSDVLFAFTYPILIFSTIGRLFS